ncbi:MAG TPA: lamin tail domain-containing protein [Candidatus Poseidoniales archaeon]|nr:MAG: hypothetical protein CXT70_01900 [Euryarchaeota archaeon]HIF90833.1 lamin tail domain-containing protein [Candidatus Poseidoniales archaeon]
MQELVCSHTEREDGAITAVIEFLTAFVLFLMILTAFLSLAQLQMGSNDPALDRLDGAAVLGMDRISSDEGWFVPLNNEVLDFDNATANWHLYSAEQLDEGRVQAGLLVDGEINETKINALHNVSEDGFALGIGLQEGYSFHLNIMVTDSSDLQRVNKVLFDGGTDKYGTRSSSTSYRNFYQNDETIQIILEVHDGGRKENQLQITEVHPRPTQLGPEWIEIYNPNDFAVSLYGWSLTHTSGSSTSNLLLKQGIITGHATAIFSGDPSSQESGNASEVIDLGAEGFLGVGSIDNLANGNGQIALKYTQVFESRPVDIQRINWGGDTGLFLINGQSIVWDGTSMFDSASWSISDDPTPGN